MDRIYCVPNSWKVQGHLKTRLQPRGTRALTQDWVLAPLLMPHVLRTAELRLGRLWEDRRLVLLIKAFCVMAHHVLQACLHVSLSWGSKRRPLPTKSLFHVDAVRDCATMDHRYLHARERSVVRGVQRLTILPAATGPHSLSAHLRRDARGIGHGSLKDFLGIRKPRCSCAKHGHGGLQGLRTAVRRIPSSAAPGAGPKRFRLLGPSMQQWLTISSGYSCRL